MLDLQKANMWKRISAFIFDSILLCITVVGVAFLLSTVLDYDGYSEQLEERYQIVAETYGVDLNITQEEYDKLSPEEIARYDEATLALSKDGTASYLYTMMLNLTLIITTFSILIAYLILEFLVPLLLGNGQTLGKKVFGVGVMRLDGVKVTPVLLFIRTVLGKFTVETMIPVLLGIMVYFAVIDALGVVLIAGLLLLQVLLLAFTRARTPIHDKLASTVTVDLASQMIFESREALVEYQKRIHAEQAEKAEYGRL